MKKIVFIFLLFGATIWYFTSKQEPLITEQLTPIPSPTSNEIKSATVNGEVITYAFFQTEPSAIALIPNFAEKKSSRQLLEEGNCAAGINGGFYDTNSQPLGLFASNGQTIQKQSSSALINGFFSINEEGSAIISTEVPDDSSEFRMQTGPLLALNGQQLALKIKNDEPARRMVAALSTDGSVIFIALYNNDATFDGPLLTDVPTIVTAINSKELLNISDAINLDGGSASAFYNGTTELSELTPIGSFFCVKDVVR